MGVAWARPHRGACGPGLHAVVLDYLSYTLLVVAAIFIVSGLVSLGKSTRLGLPTGQTELNWGNLSRQQEPNVCRVRCVDSCRDSRDR